VDHAAGDKADASTLTGVSETALLTLNGRAHQARHPKPILDDPMAIRLVDAIDRSAGPTHCWSSADFHYLGYPRPSVSACAVLQLPCPSITWREQVDGELEADQYGRVPLRCQRIATALGALPAFRQPNIW